MNFMLPFCVYQRSYLCLSATESSSLRTPRLCVKLSGSFPPSSPAVLFPSIPLFPLSPLSPLLPSPYGHSFTTASSQPFCNQPVTHCFHRDGGVPPHSQKGTTNDY